MKNRVVLGALLVALAAFACTSETVSSTGQQTSPTEPAAPDDPSKTPEEGTPPAAPTAKPGPSSAPPPATPDAGPSDTGAPGPTPFTKAEALALFAKSCNGCHEEWGADFTKTTVGVASEQVPTLSLVHKGDKQKSYLFHKVAGTHASVGGSGVRMPKGKPALAKSDVDRLGAFIDAL